MMALSSALQWRARLAGMAMAYDPKTASYLCFAEARRAVAQSSDTPRGYLERCPQRICEGEPKGRALGPNDSHGARAAGGASTTRLRPGRAPAGCGGLA